jgi:ADP-ribose pyrophosphatase YjhB (NUDIX family)
MAKLGVMVAVLDGGRVLLTRRHDFPVWCLPGGAIDPGESAAAAAVREVREETGLEVELTRLVGIYSRPRWSPEGNHEALYAARVAGGVLLRVTDDGVGMPVVVPRASGVRNMGDRARRLDGECEITPGSDGGTVVDWRIPLR